MYMGAGRGRGAELPHTLHFSISGHHGGLFGVSSMTPPILRVLISFLMVSVIVGTARGMFQGVVLNFYAFSLHWFTTGFALFSCSTNTTMASPSKMHSPPKFSSCSSPCQPPGKRDRRGNDGGPFGSRVIGINLRSLSQSMPGSMRQARVGQNMGGLPNTKDKNFYENFQALMNAFLAACGGDAGYPQLLMSELGNKVFGDQAADHIDFDVVENLKATLKDTNVDFGPD